MPNLAWTQDLHSGDDQIDAHNRNLLFLLNALFASGSPCPGHAEPCRKIEQAVCFLARSFAREEALMSAREYAGRRAHKEQHRALLCELQSMKRTYECGRYDTTVVLERLGTWAIQHIRTWDKPLGQHLHGEVMQWPRIAKPDQRQRCGSRPQR